MTEDHNNIKKNLQIKNKYDKNEKWLWLKLAMQYFS
jgi:hypothetical protein